MTSQYANPPPEYFLDNYGVCKKEPCRCLVEGWRGRACPDWVPSGKLSFDELRAFAKGHSVRTIPDTSLLRNK